jgi:hypothetical protein
VTRVVVKISSRLANHSTILVVVTIVVHWEEEIVMKNEVLLTSRPIVV